MALARYSSAAFSVASGVAVAASATVTVRRADTGALASIFEDRDAATPLANPFSADAQGRFDFCAAGLAEGYDITVDDGVESHTLENVPIGTAAEVDAGTFGASVMGAEQKSAAQALLSGEFEDRASDSELDSEDFGKTLRATASFTQSFSDAATLGDRWFVNYIVPSGVTTVFAPGSPDDIDGAASLSVTGPAVLTIWSDGVADFHAALVGPASDTRAGLLEIATQAEQETGTDTARAVTPGRQHFHPGHPKFWAYATVSGGTPTLQTSYNVTSITDTATGRLTVTIATDFSGANWASLTSVDAPEANARYHSTDAKAAGSVELNCKSSTPANVDPNAWSVAGLGDHA